MNELIVLTPDKNMEAAIKGILARQQSLAIRQLDARMIVHPARDPGCLKDGYNLLRPFSRQYAHALILMDRDGCGREKASQEQLELEIEGQLRSSGWDDRAAAVVIDPELEMWVWSDSPHLPKELGWEDDMTSLMKWLVDHRFLSAGRHKPERPKEAMESILRLERSRAPPRSISSWRGRSASNAARTRRS